MFSTSLFSQQSKAKKDSVKIFHGLGIPVPKSGGYRPEITLQEALILAEKFIQSEKIDINHYYLNEARWMLYGSPKGPKEERWYFCWDNEDGACGHYVEITVSMKGVVRRQPTM